MSVAIVKYNAGNLFSVKCALNRLGVEAIITNNEDELRHSDKVIFPGVGDARAAMEYLRSTNLDKIITNLSNPVLGICIGQQLLCSHSEEGDVDCLGVFDAKVKRFPQQELTVPHTGWDTISTLTNNQLITQALDGSYVYYVHSYYVPINECTIATTDYILPFSAAMKKDNFYATQFHPEKSGSVGELILKNFLSI